MTASKSKKNKYEIDMCNGTVLDKLISFSIPLMLSKYSPASFQCSRYRRCRKIFRKPRSGGSRLYDSANQCIYESFYRSFPRSERTGCPFLCDKTGKADV